MLRPIDIAQVCHEVNRAYCASIGDHSQPPWQGAPDWAVTSAHNGVELHIRNPNATPEDSHASWLAEKVAAGWVYGPVKDPALKQHPCCVPYNELPLGQQTKDYLFRAVVHALTPHLEKGAIDGVIRDPRGRAITRYELVQRAAAKTVDWNVLMQDQRDALLQAETDAWLAEGTKPPAETTDGDPNDAPTQQVAREGRSA